MGGGSTSEFWRSSLWEVWNVCRAAMRQQSILERSASLTGYIAVSPYRDSKKPGPSLEDSLPQTYFHRKKRDPIPVPSVSGARSTKEFFAGMKRAKRIMEAREYWSSQDAKRPVLVEYMRDLGEEIDE